MKIKTLLSDLFASYLFSFRTTCRSFSKLLNTREEGIYKHALFLTKGKAFTISPLEVSQLLFVRLGNLPSIPNFLLVFIRNGH